MNSLFRRLFLGCVRFVDTRFVDSSLVDYQLIIHYAHARKLMDCYGRLRGRSCLIFFSICKRALCVCFCLLFKLVVFCWFFQRFPIGFFCFFLLPSLPEFSQWVFLWFFPWMAWPNHPKSCLNCFGLPAFSC